MHVDTVREIKTHLGYVRSELNKCYDAMKVYQEKLFCKLQHLFKAKESLSARDDFHDSMRSKVSYEGLRLCIEVGISGANKSYVAIPQDRIRGTCHIYGKGGKGQLAQAKRYCAKSITRNEQSLRHGRIQHGERVKVSRNHHNQLQS